MNKTIFSVALSVSASICVGAAAAVQSDSLATRFQEEIREPVSLMLGAPAADAERIGRNGDTEALAFEAVGARAGVRSARDEGRITRFMSEDELEAGAASLGLVELGGGAEDAIELAELLMGPSPESDFAQIERVIVTFSEAAPSAAVETPAPAAFALMLAALGLGGVVLRRPRKTRGAA